MTLLTTEVRTLVGSEVDVETAAGIVHGTLLSYTAQSLWLVAGDDDFMVPIASVRSVHSQP
jgi:molybdopterin-binding protein